MITFLVVVIKKKMKLKYIEPTKTD